MTGFYEPEYVAYILRIVFAGLCGIAIGFERQYRSKDAGIRTHCVVACAAALMMIISKYAFFDVIQTGLIEGADIRLDPSRVASTIVSGVGFLGAGTIFVHKSTITGLTTAAGLWATAGVGMAFGSGMHMVGLGTTIIIVLTQVFLHMNFKFLQTPKIKVLIIRGVSQEGYQQHVIDVLAGYGIPVQDTRIRKNSSGSCDYTFVMEFPEHIHEEDLTSKIPHECEITSINDTL